MDFGNLQANWTVLGERDPLWAILVDPSKRGNRWRVEEFFETGRREIDAALARGGGGGGGARSTSAAGSGGSRKLWQGGSRRPWGSTSRRP